MNRVAAVLLAVASAPAMVGSPAAAEEVILGVLEHPQCKKEPLSAVRVTLRERDQD